MIWIFGDSFVAPKQNKNYVNDIEPWFTQFGKTINFAEDGRGPKESFTDFLEHQDRIKKNDIVIFVLSSIDRNFDYIDLDTKFYNLKNLGLLYLFYLKTGIKFFIMFKNREDLHLQKDIKIPEKDFFILSTSLDILSHPDDYGDNSYVNHLSNYNHITFKKLFNDWLRGSTVHYNFETYETLRDDFIYD